jgi:hypothetical protein
VSPVARYLVVALVRLLLLAAAGWFAFADDALGAGAPLLSRIAVVLAFFVLSILLGEFDRLRSHFALLLAALRSSGGSPQAAAATHALAQALEGGAVGPPDPREAVEILVKALRARNPDTRQRVHERLRTLTGQDLPLDPKAWESWWAAHRDGWKGKP